MNESYTLPPIDQRIENFEAGLEEAKSAYGWNLSDKQVGENIRFLTEKIETLRREKAQRALYLVELAS